MSSARSVSPGYSLVEMLVVLGVLALLAVVATPIVSASVERMTLSADARALTTALRALRAEALDSQTDIVVTTSGSANIASVAGHDDIALSSGTAIEVADDARKRFVVHWDGTSTGALVLTRGASSLRVAGDPLSGRFTVGAAK